MASLFKRLKVSDEVADTFNVEKSEGKHVGARHSVANLMKGLCLPFSGKPSQRRNVAYFAVEGSFAIGLMTPRTGVVINITPAQRIALGRAIFVDDLSNIVLTAADEKRQVRNVACRQTAKSCFVLT